MGICVMGIAEIGDGVWYVTQCVTSRTKYLLQ